MRIVLTGRTGQLGWELDRSLSVLGQVFAFDRRGMDLGNPDAITTRLREIRPNVIVNAAAYTAVDDAERESALAIKVNAVAPGILAEEAKPLDALLIHYSTDYVFDGAKKAAYCEDDEPRPLNAYGRSKLEGEKAIRASGCAHLILRTSWVYASRGRNFVLTMLRLAGEGRALRVVNDQSGAPTWSRDLAELSAQLLANAGPDTRATYHASAAGKTTWYEFARRIFELRGLSPIVTPISSHEYPTPAARPRNSLLDCRKLENDFGVSIPSWQRGLGLALAELR